MYCRFAAFKKQLIMLGLSTLSMPIYYAPMCTRMFNIICMSVLHRFIDTCAAMVTISISYLCELIIKLASVVKLVLIKKLSQTPSTLLLHQIICELLNPIANRDNSIHIYLSILGQLNILTYEYKMDIGDGIITSPSTLL